MTDKDGHNAELRSDREYQPYPSTANEKSITEEHVLRDDRPIPTRPVCRVESVDEIYGKVVAFSTGQGQENPLTESDNQSAETENDTIKGEEDRCMEFKSSLRWDYHQSKVNTELELEVIIEMAAFLNTKGGQVIIGVNDEGCILGLDNDFKTLGKKQNRDGFGLQLDNLISNFLGGGVYPYITLEFQQKNEKDICIIRAKRCNHEVYVGKDRDFYIRRFKSKVKLNSEEAHRYINENWR
ncbi:MAG: ATP-binding protein [Candidatus Shapirobacteria bacterium]|jgi:hypothetical protein